MIEVLPEIRFGEGTPAVDDEALTPSAGHLHDHDEDRPYLGCHMTALIAARGVMLE